MRSIEPISTTASLLAVVDNIVSDIEVPPSTESPPVLLVLFILLRRMLGRNNKLLLPLLLVLSSFRGKTDITNRSFDKVNNAGSSFPF
jgi:hypothetical protein